MYSNSNYLFGLTQFLDHIIERSLSILFFAISATENLCLIKFTLFFIIHDIDMFCIILDTNFNKIANKVQKYSIFHNGFYYKSCKNRSKCHFNFLKTFVEKTYIDKCNTLHFN